MADHDELVFTPDDWSTPQTVVVTGMPDALADGSVPYSIELDATTSDDLGYDGLDPDDVSLVNLDGNMRDIVVAPLTIETSETGTQASFTVVLTAQPTAAVTIGVASSDAGEATASTSQLVFTPASWDTPQTVMVTGIDDGVVDGDQPYTILLAPAIGDVGYAGLDPMRVRRWPTEAETRELLRDVRVAADEYIAGAAGGMTLGELVTLLGRRADGLTELWNDWGAVRPILLEAS